MIEHTLDTEHAILVLRPTSALAREDFVRIAEQVDPFIETVGPLAGLVIDAPQFPGWQDFGALAAHLRFVREHHRHIRRVALVTDAALGQVAERLASHFVAAEIRRFAGGELAAARQWIANGP